MNDSLQISKQISSSQLCALYSKDSFLLNHTIQKVKKNESREIKVLTGDNLTSEYVQSQLLTLDFFSSDEFVIVFHAEMIKENVWEDLLRQQDNIQKKILFCSYKKKFSKAVEKELPVIEISELRSWDFDKFYDIVLNEINLKLESKSKQYLLQYFPDDTYQISNFLNQIKLRYPQKITHAELVSEVEQLEASFFHYADLLNQGKLTVILKTLLESREQQIHSILPMMRSHVSKILYPDYQLKKKKLSQFDNNINRANQNLSKKKLFQMWSVLSHMEMISRVDKTSLQPYIKESLIKES